MSPWVEEEFRTLDLNDERLDRRVRLVVHRLGQKPGHKFTTACPNRAERKGAYRLVNNPFASAEQLLAPHAEATRQRIAEHAVVIISQDTSEADLTRPNEQVQGAGPLNESDRLGLHFHHLFALTPQRIPLGTLQSTIWARDPEAFALPAKEKAAFRKKKPSEEKESFRWLAGYRTACEVASSCPDTHVIIASDSEGDIYECIDAGQRPAADGDRKADWIIRACQDRAVRVKGDAQGKDSKAATSHLFDQVARTPVLQRLTLEISKRKAKSKDGRKRKQPRSARKAVVSVQAAKVTLRGPYRPGGALADIGVNAVLLREEQPPQGEPPIAWLLLTNLPIDVAEAVLRVIEYYCCRWQIEIYFRVLKSGCQVETSQLETAEAFSSWLVLNMIVAWRVMHLMMLGRECPQLPAECVLEQDEWQSVYAVVKGETPPEQSPPLGEMMRLIATLGGYQGRPSDGPPGPKAMWIGIQRMTDLAQGWRAQRQQQQRKNGKPAKEDAKRPGSSARDPTVQSSGVR